MPGLLMTTSQRASAASPPDPVASTSKPSRLGAGGHVVDQHGRDAQGAQPADAGLALDAQSPDADGRVSERGPGDRLAHSDQGSDGCPRSEEGRRVGAAAGAVASSSSRSRWSSVAAGPVGSLRRQTQGGAALVDVADALEGPGLRREPEQGAEPGLVGGVLKRLGAVEDRAEVGAVMNGLRTRSMKQHLSHVPHQWSSRSAGSWWKARLQLRKAPWNRVSRGELLGHPQLRARPQVREDGEPGPSAAATTSWKPRSNSSPLDHWWLTGRPSTTSVGTEADHSLDSTTASLPRRTAATTAAAVTTAVMGTCPLRKPRSPERRTSGSIARAMRSDGQARDGRGPLDSVEALARRVDHAQRGRRDGRPRRRRP